MCQASLGRRAAAQQKRFAAYLESLARAAKHADRSEPLKNYCRGLLLPLERKSVEPMAARLEPDNVRQAHQSLHHLLQRRPGTTMPCWLRYAAERWLR